MIKEIENLLKSAGIEEASAEAKLIATSISNQTIEEIILNKDIKNKDEILKVVNERIKTGKPVQQILGFGYFMNSKYKVNEDVLIPRDETELLVIEGYNLVKNIQGKINILEIGTGSGCICIELAKKLKDKDIEILSVDISSSAIQTALENADSMGVIRKVIFRKSDIYSKIRPIEKFDLIISNPPYIPLSQKEYLQKEVLFEPENALFTNDDEGLEYYKKIISDARQFLKPSGYVAFELGQGQSEKVQDIFKINNFKNINITKDLAGIERVISAEI